MSKQRIKRECGTCEHYDPREDYCNYQRMPVDPDEPACKGWELADNAVEG